MAESLDDKLMATLASSVGSVRERAFRELVRRHALPLTRGLRALLSEGADLEDVVQETFLRVYQARARYEPGQASFATWLQTIARRQALDLLRKRRRRGLEPLEHEPESRLPTPEARLQGAGLQATVRAAVDRLPPLDREVLLLRHDEELSYDVIAQRLETSPSAVKQRVFRARKRLRELLGEESA